VLYAICLVLGSYFQSYFQQLTTFCHKLVHPFEDDFSQISRYEQFIIEGDNQNTDDEKQRRNDGRVALGVNC